MFCNGCGLQIPDSSRFCSSCGRAVPTASAVTPASRIARHISTLGVLWAIYAAFRFLGVIWIAFIGHWILPAVLGNILNQPDFPLRGFPFERLIHAGLFFVLMFSTAALVAEIMLAWGFLNRQRWARVLGIVMGIVVLISIPFGTALGVYTLVILLGAGAEEEYRQIAEKTA